MKAQEFRKLIREEISKVLKEATFKAFGGIHSDEQLASIEDNLKIYRSTDPMVWEKYIETLVAKGWNKRSHKEHPHYQWAVKQLSKLK